MNFLKELEKKLKGKRLEEYFDNLPPELSQSGGLFEIDYKYILVKSPKAIWKILEEWSERMEIPLEDAVSLALLGNDILIQATVSRFMLTKKDWPI